MRYGARQIILMNFLRGWYLRKRILKTLPRLVITSSAFEEMRTLSISLKDLKFGIERGV